MHVEYNTDNSIKQVYDTSSGKKVPLPHVSLYDVVEDTEKQYLENNSDLIESWRKYMAVQTGLFAIAGYGFVRNYINDDQVYALKQLKMMRNLTQDKKLLPQLGGIGAVASAAGMMYRFWDLGQLERLQSKYIRTAVDNIVIIQEKTYSHQDYNTIYYNISPPLGYMLAAEADEQFKPIEDGNKVHFFSVMTQFGIGWGGFLWLARYGTK